MKIDPFSLLVDGSTDTGLEKLNPLTVKIFDLSVKGARYSLIIHEVLVAMEFFLCRSARSKLGQSDKQTSYLIALTVLIFVHIHLELRALLFIAKCLHNSPVSDASGEKF